MAVAQAIRAFRRIKQVTDEIDPDELRKQLGEALDNPDVREQLQMKPHSMIAGAGSRLITGAILRHVWPLLISFVYLDFITGGVALGYLNFHFFARHFGHRKGFAPLGSEWKLWRTLLGWPGFALKYVEIGGLIFIDLLVFAIILLVASLAFLVLWAIVNPMEFCSNVDPAVAAITGAALGPAGLAVGLSCAAVGVVAG